MKVSRLVIAILAVLGAASIQSVQAAGDVVQAPTGYFVPTDAQRYDWPYYRWNGEDWGWQHGAIAGSISSAVLNISAFDVDAPYEVDNIYAKDNGVWTLLGSLNGGNDIWAYTAFTLGSNFYDDINAGLEVKIQIDANHGGWAVTLAKSSLCTDNDCNIPGPVPGVPEPETYAMLLAGLGLVGVLARRRG